MIGTTTNKQIEQQVRNWLEQVVIGLNLCPFASKPYQDKQIRITISNSQTEADLLSNLTDEFVLMSQTMPEEIETTLLVIPQFLTTFDDYNQFLDEVDALVEQQGYEGVFQIASFHPDYQFGGTEPNDSENLTNRSPYPILHLIREASLERALKHYPNPELIPENNIERVCTLTEEQKKKLFPYLFSPH
ncbi:MAG: hypothetical protein ISEC1_P0020 [Thiomicrorhabdus sp.]|nr:MAG: hypothetical protein ISEC1_P0020 [Thiomicrorhabdus sp.]